MPHPTLGICGTAASRPSASGVAAPAGIVHAPPGMAALDIRILMADPAPSFGALSAAVAEAFGPVGARLTRRGARLTLRAALTPEAAEIAAAGLLARLPGAVLEGIGMEEIGSDAPGMARAL